MSETFQHPYAPFLHRVAKPSRYAGGEHGVRRKPWDASVARVCLAFPEVYDIGMSHLGFRILYKILNDDPRTLAERCYAPWIDMQHELREHGKLLVSLESARPLSDFDVVGFSLQYELTYSNVLGMLELGGIPLRALHRSDDDPLIVAGGPVATHCEPMALFFDAVLVGDGEEALTEIAIAWKDGQRDKLGRRERLVELAKIRGVYVPSLYSTSIDADTGLDVVTGSLHPDAPFPIERRLLDDIDRFPFPDDGPVGGPEAIFDRMSIEIARGCTEGCRFCQAGMIYRPVRERDPERVVETVLSALEKSGHDEVSLTALSTADVSCISPLIKRLVEKTAPERVSLGVASLRAYGLAEELLDDLGRVRSSGLTFAPEAGTQRMRDVINKNVTEAQLLETAERTFSRGFDKMKLYFICGLPTETDDDVLGIVGVGKNALAVGKRVGGRPTVTVSVSVHVPKPHTPFQWCAMDSLDEIERKQQLLKSAARDVRGLKLRMHDATASVLEAIFARGDRRLADVIERAFRSGARFDSWDEQLRSDVWQEAFEHFAIETGRYLGTLPVGARLPWDHFDIGLEDGFLAREYRKALKSRLSPPCGKVAGMFVHHTNASDAEGERRRLVCYDCGVACDLSRMRNERIVFLRRMGAVEAAQSQPTALDSAPDDRARSHNRNLYRPERFRPLRPGGAPIRYRLRYSKTGPAALLGHLDLMRELARTLRRAGVRIAYSEGYHPKPDLSFGPALSLGVSSLDEYVDCKLIDPPAVHEILPILNAVAARGLEFLDAVALLPRSPALGVVISAARWVIGFADSALAEIGGRPALAARIDDFVAAECVRVRRDVSGVGRMIDARALVRHIALDDAAREVFERAGIVGRLVPVVTETLLSPSGSVRVAELVEVLAGAAMPYVAVRSALLAGSESPLSKIAEPPLRARSVADALST